MSSACFTIFLPSNIQKKIHNPTTPNRHGRWYLLRVSHLNTVVPTQTPGLPGQSRDYLMSAHVVGKGPNSLALGVPFLACTRRPAPETGPGRLAYLFLQTPATPISDTDIRSMLSIKCNKRIALSVALCSRVFLQTKLPFLSLYIYYCL